MGRYMKYMINDIVKDTISKEPNRSFDEFWTLLKYDTASEECTETCNEKIKNHVSTRNNSF